MTFHSTVQNKTVDPVWREIFTQPLPDLEPLPKLRVECFDRDAVSKDDSMGSFEVDLAELRNQAVSKKWHALQGGEGEIELVLQWYHDPALAYDPFEAPAADALGLEARMRKLDELLEALVAWPLYPVPHRMKWLPNEMENVLSNSLQTGESLS